MAVDNNSFMNAGRPTGPNAPRFRLPEFDVIGIPGGSVFGAAPHGSSHDGVPRTSDHVVMNNPIQHADSQPFAVVTGAAATPTAGNPNLTPAPTGQKGQFDINVADPRTWFPGVMTIFHTTRTPGEGTTQSGDASAARQGGWFGWDLFSTVFPGPRNDRRGQGGQ
jgi:hypothetical protein